MRRSERLSKAVESSEAETPWSATYAVPVDVDAGAEAAAAETFRENEWHEGLFLRFWVWSYGFI
jgi:hypothetical protein